MLKIDDVLKNKITVEEMTKMYNARYISYDIDPNYKLQQLNDKKLNDKNKKLKK
jgi:hypothetical protein